MRAQPYRNPRSQPFRSVAALVVPLTVAMIAMTVGAPSAVAQGASGSFIRLRYATFDPLQSQPQVDAALRLPPMEANDTGRFLVQFQGPVLPQWLASVAATGVTFEAYVPDYTYLAQMTLAQAAGLPRRFSFVRWVGPFHPAYKIDPEVMRQQAGVTLVADTFTEAEGLSLGLRLQRFGAGVLQVSGNTIAVVGSPQLATQLARTSEVRWVEVYRPKRIVNDRSAAIMGVAGAQGIRVNGFYGDGQVVAVADTGLDTGNLDSLNADFKGRVVQVIPLGRRPGNAWDDPNGHGTHCAGSVLGNGVNSGSDPSRRSYDNSFAGIAPEARLVFQALMDRNGELSGTPANLYELFVEPYRLGARVHSNSWGGVYASGESRRGWYWQECAQLDKFVYENPDMVLVFAAGNEGTDSDRNGVIDRTPPSLTPEAAAKNILVIGASEGNRPPNEGWGGASRGTWGYLFNWAPFNTDYVSDNPNGMAAFSSRGPTADGRIKPDLVAPGTNIVSVWSRPAALQGEAGWGEFAGPYRDNTPSSKYCYMGGTSMATPLAAGAAALVREFFAKGRPRWEASAALVKAALINGARDMSPGQYGTGAYREVPERPNGVSGWGRIDVANALVPRPPRSMFWIDRPVGLKTGQYHRLQYRVRDSSEPLIVTLVWTDPPAVPVVSRALVNDLDLRVTGPDGQVTLGNRPAGSANPDRVNNVECVEIANPATGIYEVRVEGANIAMPAQDPSQTYALVVSGAGEPLGGRTPDVVPPQVSIVSPADGATVSGVVRIEVAASDNNAVDRVSVRVGDNIRLGSRFGPPYVFQWNTAGWRKGVYVITAEATDFGRNTATAFATITVR